MAIAAVSERVRLIGTWVPSGLPLATEAPAALVEAVEDPAVPLPDHRSRREKWDDFSRSVRLSAQGLFDRQHNPPTDEGLHKPWQRLLHRLFPGTLALAAFSEFQPNPAGDQVPSGPVRRPVNVRAWMPKVHFETGEAFFPTDPGFDGDSDLTNNPDTYRRGQADNNQEPTFFVNARQRGEYTVLTYRTYYVDNQYMNRHNHDWEGFAVYLATDPQGRLRPAYLCTFWHHEKFLIPWHELALDARGRPMVTVDAGAHGTRPVLKGMGLNPGRTLHPDGFWQDGGGRSPVRIRLPGDAPGLVGADPVAPLPDGRDPRTAYFPSTNWIAGYWRTNDQVGYGPKHGEAWDKPLHPLAWRPRGAVAGEVVATIPPPPA